MNATEIIKEISRLPEEERGKVIDFVYHLPNAETLAAIKEAEKPEDLDSFASSKDLFKSLDVEC